MKPHLSLITIDDEALTQTPTLISSLAPLLPEEDTDRISKQRFPSDKALLLASRILARKGISDLLAQPLLNEIHIKREGGYASHKPVFVPKEHQRMVFHNMSHDGKVVAGVFDLNYPVGVDCAAVKARRDSQETFFTSMRRVFDATEWSMIRAVESALDSLPVKQVSRDGIANRRIEQVYETPQLAARQLSRFMLLWAIKEAHLKCRGLGLTLDPAELRVRVGKERDIRVEHDKLPPEAPFRYNLYSLLDRQLHFVCVCRETEQIVDEEVSIQSLSWLCSEVLESHCLSK